MTKTLKVENAPDDLYEGVVELAERDGISLRAAQIQLMRIGVSEIRPKLGRNSDGIRTEVSGTRREREERESDPRHRAVRELIMKCHLETFKQKCPWGGGEAGQLGQLLKAVPGMTVEEFGVCVRNRFRSEGVKPDRPMVYLANLTSYGAGPLDKFGKTKLPLKPAPVQYLA